MINKYHDPVAFGDGNMGDCRMMQFSCAQSAKKVSTIRKPARFSVYTLRKCENCKQPLTGRDRQDAPYADGWYLCAVCRAEYMELHHPDPFRDDAVPEVMQA